MREIIPIESEEQWLQERSRDITSTGMAALFDLSPYCTKFELFHAHKNGLELPFKENDRTVKGKAIEQYAAQVAAEELSKTHGPVVAVRRLDVYIRIPGERIGSSFDFEVEFEDGHLLLLEIKAVDYFQYKEKWFDGEAPEHIEVQLQHQLEVADKYEHGAVAAFTSIYDCHIIERERDREMGASLRQSAKDYWADVDAGREPSPDYYRDGDVIAMLYRRANDPKLDKTGDEAFEAHVAKLVRLQRDKKAFDKDAKAAAVELHRMLGDATGAFTERFRVTATWTKDSVGKLVTEDMVGTYVGARKGYRQCLIKDLQATPGQDDDGDEDA